jgi:hypothetical protein
LYTGIAHGSWREICGYGGKYDDDIELYING